MRATLLLPVVAGVFVAMAASGPADDSKPDSGNRADRYAVPQDAVSDLRMFISEDTAQLWRGSRQAWRLRLVEEELRKHHSPRGPEKAKRLGALRHARERLGVVCRLLGRGLLPQVAC